MTQNIYINENGQVALSNCGIVHMTGGRPFITEWTVAGDDTARTITLPLNTNGGTFNCYVDWGDGNSSTITAYNDANRIHLYTGDGIYNVSIYGECPGWSFNNGGDKLKVTDIIYWGDGDAFGGFSFIFGGFYGCTNLKTTGEGRIISKSNLVLIGSLFRNCTTLTTVTCGIFDECVFVTNISTIFQGCSALETIPIGLFAYNTRATSISSVFNGCVKLQLHKYIFWKTDEEGIYRFVNKNINISLCFNRTSFTGIRGTAPELWNCERGTGSWIVTNCFAGNGNSLTSLDNYCDIPISWGAISCLSYSADLYVCDYPSCGVNVGSFVVRNYTGTGTLTVGLYYFIYGIGVAHITGEVSAEPDYYISNASGWPTCDEACTEQLDE